MKQTFVRNQSLLNNHKIKGEIKGEVEKVFEMNENRNTNYKNLRDAAKAVLSRKFVAKSGYMEKQKGSQTENLTLPLEELGKEQTEPKIIRRKDIIMTKAEIMKQGTERQ